MSKKILGDTFEKRSAEVKKVLVANEGKFDKKEFAHGSEMVSAASLKENILIDLKAAVGQVDTLRAGTKDRKSVDITFAEFVKEKWGFGSIETFYNSIGVSGSNTSINQLMTVPEFDDSFRWLIPEVVREAVRLGLRKNPIYGSLIAAEETVSQPSVILPFINMSDAMPKKLNEAESIPVGTTSFGQKTVKLFKVGTGLKVTDEVQQYVSLNILSLYLQDVGVKLGQALDTLAIDTLINGDQASAGDACAVIGTETGTSFTYKDFLRAWIRMGRIGKMPSGILSNENQALEILELAEFKALAGKATLQNIQVQTPVPASQNYWIHGAMPTTNQAMLVDTTSALIKLNSTALRVESERIASKQLNGTYVTLTTGFATLFRDARLILDKSLAFSGNGFPSYFDIGAAENVDFKE